MKLYIIMLLLLGISSAVEYKLLDTDNFTVEYPQSWILVENNDTYKFVVPIDEHQSFRIAQISGICPRVDVSVNPKVSDAYKENGLVDDTIIHFLLSFQLK